MSLASLILEYVKVLVWPVLALVVLFRYRRYIQRLLHRLSEESEEIVSTHLGLSAKFRKDVLSVSSDLTRENVDPAVVETVRKKLKSMTRDQFRVLCTKFFTQELRVRVQVSEEIAQLARELDPADMLEFLESPLPGERVGGAIGMGAHLAVSPSLADKTEVKVALSAALADDESRVRFRAVRAIGESQVLLREFAEKLGRIAQSDRNKFVRNAAKRVLRGE